MLQVWFKNGNVGSDLPRQAWFSQLLCFLLGQLNLQDEDSEEERRGFTEPFPFPGVLNGVSPQLQSAATIKTDLSVLMQEIHNNVFEEHKVHPAPAWTKRNLRSCFIDEKQSVPTCNDLLDAHNLIAASVPEMTVNDVVDMVAKLFGPKRRHLCKIFEREVRRAALATCRGR